MSHQHNCSQFTTQIDKEGFVYHIDASIMDCLLEIDNGDGSFLEWLNDEYFREFTEDLFHREIWPRMPKEIKELWNIEAKRITADINDESALIELYSKHYDFPWSLMPLENGVSIRRKFDFSVSLVSVGKIPLCENDALMIFNGNITSHDTGYDFYGLEFVNSSLLKGGLFLRSMDMNYAKMFKIEQDNVMSLQSPTQITTKRVNRKGIELPCITIINAHANSSQIEVANGESNISTQLTEHLESTPGVIDFLNLECCNSLRFARKQGVLETGKVRTLVGHIGKMDESKSVTAFQLNLYNNLEKGLRASTAFRMAMNSVDPEDPASGSYQLVGDGRLILGRNLN
jgi:hypothetical protein